MSIAIIELVWQKSKAQGSDLLALLAIADFSNGDGESWPAVDTLATKARIGRRGIQYCLQRLVSLGELSIAVGDGPRGCNLYTVNVATLEVNASAPCTDVHRAPAVAKGVHGGAHKPSVNRHSVCTQAREEAEKEALAEFEHSWREYPKRAGSNNKQAALKAWNARIAQGHSAEEIHQGLLNYKAHLDIAGLVGTAMVKQAATFFGPNLHFQDTYAPIPKKKKEAQTDAFYKAINKTRNPIQGDFINGDSTRVD